MKMPEFMNTDDPAVLADIAVLRSRLGYESYERDMEALTQDLELEIFNREGLPVPYVISNQIIIWSYFEKRALLPLAWLCKEQRWPVGQHVHDFLALVQSERRLDLADEVWQAIIHNSNEVYLETKQHIHHAGLGRSERERVYAEYAVEVKGALIGGLNAYRDYLLDLDRFDEASLVELQITDLCLASGSSE